MNLGILGGAGLGKIGAAQGYKGPQTLLRGGHHIILSPAPLHASHVMASNQDFLNSCFDNVPCHALF